MTNAPVHAKVVCADGECGEMLQAVIHRLTRKVTHIVVKENDKKGDEPRLVPVEEVVGVGRNRVTLRGNRADLKRFDPFIERRLELVQHADYHMAPIDPTGMMIGTVPMESYYVTEEIERIPEGELTVSTGTKVRASDRDVGHVAELIVDRATREVTHFVLERSGKEITLPLTAIDYVAENMVYLKLEEQALDMLPSVPKQPTRGPWADSNIELVGMVFEDTGGAAKALDFVTDLHHRGTLKIRNAAVLIKQPDGKIAVDERGDLEGRGGAVVGAVLGGVIGLLTGGVGLLAAPLAGAAVGAVGGKTIDRGFSNNFLKSLAERLQPGKSGLLLIVQHEWVRPVRDALAGSSGVILQQELTDRLVAELVGDPPKAH